MEADHPSQFFFYHFKNLFFQSRPRSLIRKQDLTAHSVDSVALFVEHIVIFKYMFARVKMKSFNFALRGFYGARDHFILNRLVFGYAKRFHHALDAVRAENAHQVVLERHEKARRSWVALATCAAAQLVVYTPRFVPFGAVHIEPAGATHFFPHIGIRLTAAQN